MKETKLKQCSFCGQYVMSEEAEDIREICSCDDAKRYRIRLEIYKKREKELGKLCGEGENGVFKPVSGEAYEALKKVLYETVFLRIGKVRVGLCDGSTLAISESAIERKITFKKEIE